MYLKKLMKKIDKYQVFLILLLIVFASLNIVLFYLLSKQKKSAADSQKEKLVVITQENTQSQRKKEKVEISSETNYKEKDLTNWIKFPLCNYKLVYQYDTKYKTARFIFKSKKNNKYSNLVLRKENYSPIFTNNPKVIASPSNKSFIIIGQKQNKKRYIVLGVKIDKKNNSVKPVSSKELNLNTETNNSTNSIIGWINEKELLIEKSIKTNKNLDKKDYWTAQVL
jgi:hypothetical protein